MTGEDALLAGKVLGQFEREAGGSHNRMCDAAHQIALAGGMLDTEALLRQMAVNPDSFDEHAQRPWRWLLDVARDASRRGDVLLVARICWFAHFWCDQFTPTLTRADVGWVNLFAAEPETRAAIAALGLASLAALDGEQVVCVDSTGAALPLRIVLTVCAIDVLKYDSSGATVGADLRARARGLVAAR